MVPPAPSPRGAPRAPRPGAAGFFRHPARVCMSYAEHARFALGLAWSLALAAGASVIHAAWPDVLETYTSDTICDVQRRIRDAGCRATDAAAD